MEGVEIVPVGVDGAQQIQHIAAAVVRPPQQAQGAGVLPVIQVQDQAVGHGGGLQHGAGPVQMQAGAVPGQGPHRGHKGLRPLLHVGEGIGGGLLIQGVHHAAPGGVQHQGGPVGGPGLQVQQGQLVPHRPGQGLHLLHGHSLAVLDADLVPKQAQGIAVGQYAVGPAGQGSGALLRGQSRLGAAQQAQHQQKAEKFFHVQHPFSHFPAAREGCLHCKQGDGGSQFKIS